MLVVLLSHLSYMSFGENMADYLLVKFFFIDS